MIVPPEATDRPVGAEKLITAPAGLEIAVEAAKRIPPRSVAAANDVKILRIRAVARRERIGGGKLLGEDIMPNRLQYLAAIGVYSSKKS